MTSKYHDLATLWPQNLLTWWPHYLMTSLPHDLITSWPHYLMTSWPHDLMTSWPHDPMASWPHDLMTSWHHGLMTSWPVVLFVGTATGSFSAPVGNMYVRQVVETQTVSVKVKGTVPRIKMTTFLSSPLLFLPAPFAAGRHLPRKVSNFIKMRNVKI
jgi:hypothetical protein